MKHIFANRLLLLASTLLISNVLFSNTFENNRTNNNYIEINSITTKLVNENFETAKVVAGPTITTQPTPSQVICAGSSVTFSVVAEGTGTLTYSWKRNGTTLSDGGSISGATTATLNIANIISSDAANYTCEVTDDADPTNPTYSNQAQLTVKPLPVLIKFGNTNVCIGQSTTISISGASSYLWNTGNTSDNITVNPSLNTTYNVIGNSNGCTSSANFAIQVNPLPTISISGTSTICNDTSTTLTATGALTYNWGSGLPSTNSILVNPSSNTTYTVSGTDANSCTNSASQLVVVNAIPSASVSASSPICSGNTATFSITGTPNATVVYKIGSGSNVPVTLNSSGLATVTVSGATSNQTLNLISVTLSNCQNTTFSPSSVTVTVNSIPSAPTTSAVSYCINQTANPLTAIGSNLKWYLSATGGIAEASVPTPMTASVGATTYYVSQTVNGCESLRASLIVNTNGLPIVNAGADQAICAGGSLTLAGSGANNYTWNGSVTNNVSFSPSTTATYTVIGTDANSCSNTDQVVVTVNPIPLNPTVTSSSLTYCQNQSVSSLTASGNSLKWYTTPTSATGSSIAPTPSTNFVGTTTYYVSQTVLGCESGRTPINVLINSLPITTISGTTNPICAGNNTTISANGAYNFSWNGGALGSTNSITVSPLNTTTYTVTVNSLPSINAGVDQTICAGGSVTLSASGGNTGSYVWSSSINNNQVFTPSTTATYTVTGTDSNGCSNTDQVIVTVNPIPLNPIVTSSSITYCQNQTASSLTASGSLLKWYTLSTGGTGSTSAPTPNTASAGTTTYYVSQTVLGCESGRTPINVIINSLPTLFISGNGTICAGNSTTLIASGGSGTFSWNGGVLGSTNSITVTPLNSTTYTVNGTGSNGCVGTATYTVTVNQLPTISGGVNQTICAGATVTLSGSGGTAGSYIWDNSVINSVAFTPAATNTYIVTGQGSNGCSNTASVVVTVNSIPAAPLLTPIHPNCTTNTGSIQFSGLPSTGWTINPGSINGTTGPNSSPTTFTLNNQTAGIYNFTVRDSNLCTSASSSITINPAPAPTLAPSAVAQSFMAGANPTVAQLSITSSGTPVWYTVPTGGLALPISTSLSTGTYQAAQIVNSF